MFVRINNFPILLYSCYALYNQLYIYTYFYICNSHFRTILVVLIVPPPITIRYIFLLFICGNYRRALKYKYLFCLIYL